jgi:hypothetical protein
MSTRMETQQSRKHGTSPPSSMPLRSHNVPLIMRSCIVASSGGSPGNNLPLPTVVASARLRPPELPILAEEMENEIP